MTQTLTRVEALNFHTWVTYNRAYTPQMYETIIHGLAYYTDAEFNHWFRHELKPYTYIYRITTDEHGDMHLTARGVDSIADAIELVFTLNQQREDDEPDYMLATHAQIGQLKDEYNFKSVIL